MDTKSKETKLKKVCDLSKIKTRPDDGRKYYIINRKPVSSSTHEGLIDNLYNHFFGINATTMESYFEVWMKWREQETSVSKKTIKENRFLWNALLKDQDITLIVLKDLTAKDLIIYFRNITKGRQLTRKRFNDLKSIMNGIIYLAVENGVEDTELQRLLGHTSLTMTHHYLRNITSRDETASKMRAILG